MALTPSTMLALGTSVPDFSLPEPATGKTVSLGDFRQSSALLVIFMCNHCPYVKHIRQALAEFSREYMPKGLGVVGISSNDVTGFPEDGPDEMIEEVRQARYPFPYLYDETQAVAKAYMAACTPDIFLFDAERKLVYRGQFDDSRPGNKIPVTGSSLRAAVEAVLSGQAVTVEQIPSVGCNIKWKPGNEPDYFA